MGPTWTKAMWIEGCSKEQNWVRLKNTLAEYSPLPVQWATMTLKTSKQTEIFSCYLYHEEASNPSNLDYASEWAPKHQGELRQQSCYGSIISSSSPKSRNMQSIIPTQDCFVCVFNQMFKMQFKSGRWKQRGGEICQCAPLPCYW